MYHLRVPGLVPNYDRCIFPLKASTHPRLQSCWPVSFPPQRAMHFHSVKPLLLWLPNPGIPPPFIPPPPRSPKSYPSFKAVLLINTCLLFTSPPLRGIYLALVLFCFDSLSSLSPPTLGKSSSIPPFVPSELSEVPAGHTAQ